MGKGEINGFFSFLHLLDYFTFDAPTRLLALDGSSFKHVLYHRDGSFGMERQGTPHPLFARIGEAQCDNAISTDSCQRMRAKLLLGNGLDNVHMQSVH